VNTAIGSGLIKVLEFYQERCSTMVELVQDIAFIYQDFIKYNSKLAEKRFKPEAEPILETVAHALAEVSVWRADVASCHYPCGRSWVLVFWQGRQLLRPALCCHGRARGNRCDAGAAGKEKSLARIALAVTYLK
jgi:hypothetical protein